MSEIFHVDTVENRKFAENMEQYAERAIEGVHEYLYGLLPDELKNAGDFEIVVESNLSTIEHSIKVELSSLKFMDRSKRLLQYNVRNGFLWFMTEPHVRGKQFVFDEEGGPPMTVDEFVEYLWQEYPDAMSKEAEVILDRFRRAEKQESTEEIYWYDDLE